MAINQNHLFDDVNGTRCAIVEKNVSEARANFLKSLLEFNGFTVVIAPVQAPKSAATEPAENTVEEQKPVMFTVGVTDMSFNAINAVYGRLLKAPGDNIVTMAYWQQKEAVSDDSIPYFQKRN